MNELHNIYLKEKENYSKLFESLNKHYEITMQVYDYSREAVVLFPKAWNLYSHCLLNQFKLTEPMINAILHSFLFNVSSSLSSLIKNRLLGLQGVSDVLLIRNILETVGQYGSLFEYNGGTEKYQLQYVYQLFTDTHQFNKQYFKENHKVTDFIFLKNLAIHNHMKLRDMEFEKAEKKLQYKFGWATGLFSSKRPGLSQFLNSLENPYWKNIYNSKNVDSITHLASFNLLFDDEELEIFIKEALNFMVRLQEKHRISITIETLDAQIDKNMKKLGNQIPKEQMDPLRNIVGDAQSRFEFECLVFTNGYQDVLKQSHYIFNEYCKMIRDHTTADVKRADLLFNLLMILETDLAFGFQNEYKLKYRYVVDYVIYSTIDKKFQNDILKNAEETLNTMIDNNQVSNDLFNMYFESHKFLHPNLYGYIGEYSFNIRYIEEYVHNLFEFIYGSIVVVLDLIENQKYMDIVKPMVKTLFRKEINEYRCLRLSCMGNNMNKV